MAAIVESAPVLLTTDHGLLTSSKEKINAVKRLAVSTGPLRTSPYGHVRPIDPVVFREPSSFDGRPDLGGSFALICFQRLSVPHVATRRCRGRDSRHTRGASLPVLSY